MVTKHTRELWPYEPQVMNDEQIEAAHASTSLGADQDDDRPVPDAGPALWLVYGVAALLALLVGWHFVALWVQGATL